MSILSARLAVPSIVLFSVMSISLSVYLLLSFACLLVFSHAWLFINLFLSHCWFSLEYLSLSSFYRFLFLSVQCISNCPPETREPVLGFLLFQMIFQKTITERWLHKVCGWSKAWICEKKFVYSPSKWCQLSLTSIVIMVHMAFKKKKMIWAIWMGPKMCCQKQDVYLPHLIS